MIKILAVLGITSIAYFKYRHDATHWFWYQLLSCPLCVGFWAAIFIYFNPVEFVDYAFAMSFVAFLVHKVTN